MRKQLSELNHKSLLKRKTDLVGLGGWLVIFQLRIWATIVQIVAEMNNRGGGWRLSPNFILFCCFVVCMVVCLVFFYRRDIRFRMVYIIGVGFALASFIALFVQRPTYGLLVQISPFTFVLEVIIITALFRSERVRQTFIPKVSSRPNIANTGEDHAEN